VPDYEVLIVGAGFAGAEAAYALAKRGLKVGLLTTSLDSVFLPFTKVEGPFPEGSLLAEVGRDGLKGWELHAAAKYRLEAQTNIHLAQFSITELLIKEGRVQGVLTWEGPSKTAPIVVLAVGSFLDARLHIGSVIEEAGRLSEVAYPDLYRHLQGLGFAFTGQQTAVEAAGGTPGYRVEYEVFERAEWDLESFKLGRIEGLYGLGLCVLGQATYARMAQEGLRFADTYGVR
jgi:tRNA U34 5-carboxymethylaminomethyl modifying enzyme MnmG/GidA